MRYIPTNPFGMGFWYLFMDEFYIAIDVNGLITIYGLGGPYAQKGGQPYLEG